MLKNSHCLSVKDVINELETSSTKGLSAKVASERLKKYGANELPPEEGTPLWKLVLEQFKDQLVQILLAAAIISFGLACFEKDGDRFTAFVEPFVILLILVANAVVGVVQESNAEKAIEALKSYAPDEAKVIREGELCRVEARELVLGDLVEVAVGDKVPADIRLIELHSAALRVDQAILTGESVSVQKYADSIITDPSAVKQDLTNILFSGTMVTMGRAKGVVIGTGSNTAIGEIQKSISEDDGDEKTPLKRRLDEFGDQLAKIISIICVLVWIINYRHFSDPTHGGFVSGAIYYFKIAVALAVAAIPEGLAVVITTCLALGTKRMARKNAIVRTLPSVETLGCTSVICSDKTGTLTTNRMCVSKIAIIKSQRQHTEVKEFTVEGGNYAPQGAFRDATSGEIVAANSSSPVIEDISLICSLCNDASITLDSSSGEYCHIGEPTEAALKVLVEKLPSSFSLKTTSKTNDGSAVSRVIDSVYEKLETLDFDRDRKSMSVYCVPRGKKSSRGILLVKGAPESILDRCVNVKVEDGSIIELTSTLKSKIMDTFTEYGKKEALRVLALAIKNDVADAGLWDMTDSTKFIKYETKLTFVGLTAMLDPPREEVAEAISKCHEAGIRVIVITGDNQNTAEAICKKIGILDPSMEQGEDLKEISMTGKEFDCLSEVEQREAVKSVKLFSRTEPSHKQRLVKMLQEGGHVVAMTGDGVNDAPALKRADIGVAMGSGTDVAKFAADMVLSDDNFSTIVAAVEEGRSIYNNTKQFIRYLISSNIGEVVSIFLTVLLGMPEALIPVQLLWVNLVTDGLPATALGFNPPDHQIMKQAPRSATEPIVSRWLLFRYCVIGAYVGAATVFGYAWWYLYASIGPKITLHHLMNYSKCASEFPEIGCQIFGGFFAKKAATMSLSILVTIEMFNAMNSLSENESLLTLPLWANPSLVLAITLSMVLHFAILYVPFLSNVFSISPLNKEEWIAVLLISFPIILIDEILKLLSRFIFMSPSKKTITSAKKMN